MHPSFLRFLSTMFAALLAAPTFFFVPFAAAQELPVAGTGNPSSNAKNLVPPLSEIETSNHSLGKFNRWQFAVFGTAKATMTVVGSALRVTVTETDGTDWHTQIRYNADAVNGVTYELRFRAMADASRPIRVFSEFNDPKTKAYTNTGLDKTYSLTPEWQTFTTQFTAHDAVDGKGILPEFFFGQKTGTVWLSDISLVEKPAATPAEKTASAPAEVPTVSNAGVGPKPRTGEIKLVGTVMMIKATN